MKTVGQLLNHDFKKGSLRLYDPNGNRIYSEYPDGYWVKYEYDSNGNIIYTELSKITDQKKSCEGKIVEVDGRKYQLKELD